VVLAAGTLNTLRLLFASSSMPGGLAAMPALGRHLYANGDLIGVWVKPASEATSFRATPFIGDLRVTGHEDTPIGVGGLPGFDSWPLPGVLRRLLARTWLVFGMGADSATATVRCTGGRLDLDYDPHREPIYARLRAAFARIGSTTGWKVRALGTPLSPHVGGGARLGKDAQHGVVDHRGEVYGNPGLHVADAAALPAAPGGPPSLSVAAWACHVADGIALRSAAAEAAAA
jgi:cholesterol oxidase